MDEEDGLTVVVLTTSHTVRYPNAEEKVILGVEKKDTAVLNALQTHNLNTAQS